MLEILNLELWIQLTKCENNFARHMYVYVTSAKPCNGGLGNYKTIVVIINDWYK